MEHRPNTVLVVLINSKTDFEIVKFQNWYRIPVRNAPPIVRNGTVQIIAFYHTKIFEFEKYSIKWYGNVKRISVVKRKELFPEHEQFDPKSENEYYKIEFAPLIELPAPIISMRQRRLLFIPTTEQKFFNATEINHLFNDSPLEDLLWKYFEEKKIPTERQFYISVGSKNYFLDFAIFCKAKNINVECDGDTHHTNKENVQSDKWRSNDLTKAGWSVLRFTTDDLNYRMNDTISVVNDTINKYGGVQDVNDLDNYKYIQGDDDPQLTLFD